MKNILRSAFMLIACVCLGSCYEGYVDDFATSSAQFILQQPLRTSVPDRGDYSNIYVGVDIGGKREVDMNDWATFEIAPALLEGVSGKALMPANYYELGDPKTMRVRKANMPVADVRITLTEAFYNDPLSATNYYVIPFRITGSSCDVVPEGKDYSLVCIKYVSSFGGTYYIRGSKTPVADAAGGTIPGAVTTNYYNNDISKNPTRAANTIEPDVIRRAGVAEVAGSAKYRVLLTMTPASGAGHDYDVVVSTGDGGTAVPVTHISGKFYDAPFDVYETGNQARFELSYIYQDGAEFFKVDEELIRRRDPLLDLRVESWQ
jgi:hypothetical protein